MVDSGDERLPSPCKSATASLNTVAACTVIDPCVRRIRVETSSSCEHMSCSPSCFRVPLQAPGRWRVPSKQHNFGKHPRAWGGGYRPCRWRCGLCRGTGRQVVHLLAFLGVERPQRGGNAAHGPPRRPNGLASSGSPSCCLAEGAPAVERRSCPGGAGRCQPAVRRRDAAPSRPAPASSRVPGSGAGWVVTAEPKTLSSSKWISVVGCPGVAKSNCT